MNTLLVYSFWILVTPSFGATRPPSYSPPLPDKNTCEHVKLAAGLLGTCIEIKQPQELPKKPVKLGLL